MATPDGESTLTGADGLQSPEEVPPAYPTSEAPEDAEAGDEWMEAEARASALEAKRKL